MILLLQSYGRKSDVMKHVQCDRARCYTILNSKSLRQYSILNYTIYRSHYVNCYIIEITSKTPSIHNNIHNIIIIVTYIIGTYFNNPFAFSTRIHTPPMLQLSDRSSLCVVLINYRAVCRLARQQVPNIYLL